jgi:hypothetical protein
MGLYQIEQIEHGGCFTGAELAQVGEELAKATVERNNVLQMEAGVRGKLQTLNRELKGGK